MHHTQAGTLLKQGILVSARLLINSSLGNCRSRLAYKRNSGLFKHSTCWRWQLCWTLVYGRQQSTLKQQLTTSVRTHTKTASLEFRHRGQTQNKCSSSTTASITPHVGRHTHPASLKNDDDDVGLAGLRASLASTTCVVCGGPPAACNTSHPTLHF